MLTIKTNHAPRDLIYGFELTDSEKSEFDYLQDIDTHEFFRYKGTVYDPSEFSPINKNESWTLDCPGAFYWHSYQSDSYFSGILIRYVDNYERVIVGTYYS